MNEVLSQTGLFALVLTVGSFQIGTWLQKKFRTPLLNPILIGVVLCIAGLLLTGVSTQDYQKGMESFSWLLMPATVCLALPLYEQLKPLKRHLPAILIGVAAGTVTSLAFILLLCRVFHLDRIISVSLLPKSITTALGLVLCEQNGGLAGLTTVSIMITGILGNLIGSFLCRLLRITHPIAQGVGFGTASHVIGTARATELDPLCGAVGSLSLTVAGILTAILFPLACSLL